MPARGAALCRPESAPGGRARPFSLRIGSRGASYHGAYGGGPDAAAAPVLGRRPRGGRGGVARAGRGAPPASLRLGPPPRRGARLGRREETGAVPPGDLLGHVRRELREPLPDIARGGLDDLPA